MITAPPRVVFDCVIFAQALISDSGPAAECLELARSGIIRLVLSDYVMTEIRELPAKLPARLMVTSDRVDAFLNDVAPPGFDLVKTIRQQTGPEGPSLVYARLYKVNAHAGRPSDP